MKKIFFQIVLVVFALLVAVPANAGSYKLKYESNGTVGLALNTSVTGRLELLFNVLARTGDHSPGPALIRLDNQPVWFTDGSSYWGSISIPENGAIPVLNKKELEELKLSQPNAKPIQVDERWFLLPHQIEVYFLAYDSRGRLSKDNSAAPAVQFQLERSAPITAAVTSGGAPLSADQLDAAIRDSYNKGVQDAQATEDQNKQELFQRLQKLTDENNELRRKLALVPAAGTPDLTNIMVERYIPFGLDKSDPPKLGDVMVIVDRQTGGFIAETKVVQVLGDYVWTHSKLTPLGLDFERIRLARKKSRTEKN